MTSDIRQKSTDKTARNPIKIAPQSREDLLRKPSWIRVRSPNSEKYYEVKKLLREHKLHTVCEEASCPNIGECFGKGTATFRNRCSNCYH